MGDVLVEEDGDSGGNGEIGWLVVKLKGKDEGRGCGGCSNEIVVEMGGGFERRWKNWEEEDDGGGDFEGGRR